MPKKWLVNFVIWSLRTARIDGEGKARITAGLLNNLGAIPISTIVSFDAMGTLLVSGKPVDMELALQIKEGATLAKSNTALKLVNEQIKFQAIEFGVHQGTNQDLITFSKAALWIVQEQNNLLNKISGE